MKTQLAACLVGLVVFALSNGAALAADPKPGLTEATKELKDLQPVIDYAASRTTQLYADQCQRDGLPSAVALTEAYADFLKRASKSIAAGEKMYRVTGFKDKPAKEMMASLEAKEAQIRTKLDGTHDKAELDKTCGALAKYLSPMAGGGK